jgi:hypothetical protein
MRLTKRTHDDVAAELSQIPRGFSQSEQERALTFLLKMRWMGVFDDSTQSQLLAVRALRNQKRKAS